MHTHAALQLPSRSRVLCARYMDRGEAAARKEHQGMPECPSQPQPDTASPALGRNLGKREHYSVQLDSSAIPTKSVFIPAVEKPLKF